MDDLLSEFLTETGESIAVLDVELVKLEQSPDPAVLQNIFRLVHTIKGTCGFLGLPRLEHVAHASENVLGKFRDGELTVTPSIITLILGAIDRIKAILSHLEQTESEPDGNDQDLIDQLNAVAEGGEAKAEPKKAKVKAEKPKVEIKAAPEPEPEPEPVREPEPEPEVAAGEAHEEAPVRSNVPANTAQPPAVRDGGNQLSAEGPKDSAVAAQTIRVNVELLENLMTLVSELVLTRNQLLQMVRGRDDSEFTAPLQRLSHITTDLQEGVMKTRMQPIGNAWAKLPRIVRDLSVEMGKKIDLQMLGAETELDRQVLELIKDPLTHMVRNSADHGLEPPNERKMAGKPEIGKIVLNAYHEGGHIIIEISDDGRGLNIERIKAKVLQNGLATEAEVESMTAQQIQQFIFKAGLSTAEKVTSVSGRGVGMDVVRTNIERIGGTVEMKSQPGRGSTFIIKIPLTLAIVSALIVECAEERFAIPQISVLELVRVTANSEHGIEMINNAPVLRLRDRLLPLVSLKKLLKLNDDKDAERQETFIVVTQVGTYTFGIIVDRVFDTEEIVVKPVAPILRHITMFSGNTILGDGSVIMILDPNGIASSTGESGMLGGGQAAEATTARDSHSDSKTSLLVFRACGDDLKAVPLALVARLEEIDVKDIEHSHGKPMVQYRGHLMPLLSVDGSTNFRAEGRQPVLVFSDRDHTMGLVVEEIVDIVEDRLKVELTANQPGVIGTAVIAGKATTIVDAGYYLPQAFGDWFGAAAKDFGSSDDSGAPRLLLVDDSPFFRNLLTPLLSVAGYDVVAVEGADRALHLREQGREFDLIISDIEMPGMSGFEFAMAVRGDPRWQHVPMIALSSHASDKDFERGRMVGFNDYVAKFDRDSLLSTIAQTIAALKGAA